jgi:hypothetical protein
MQRNFKQYPDAALIAPENHSMKAIAKLAESLVVKGLME